MAIVANRSNVDSVSASSDDEDDVPLGTFLYESLPDSELDSVESVRELRERE